MDNVSHLAAAKRTLPRLHDFMRCITFAAPSPFAHPPRVERPVLESRVQAWHWLVTNSFNYVNNNDPVPRFPTHLKSILDHSITGSLQGCSDYLSAFSPTELPNDPE